MRAGSGGSSLVARLGLSFLAVALISIAVLAALTAALAAADISALAARQRAGAVGAIAVTAAAAWDRNGTWASAKLAPVLDLAARSGSYTEIRDLHGDVAAVSRGFDGQPAPDEVAQAIVVRGRQVGDVAVRFTRPGADLALRTTLLRAIAAATGVAALVALGRVLDDLQSLASADAAALHLARRHCDLADIAARAADSVAARADTACLTLERRLGRADVLADAGRLHQLTANLLTNALKFTPPGGRVVIETWTSGPAAVLRVTDTGVGIPADEMPRIFDRFWRGQQAAPASGSGIGLAIAAELAAAHAGRLTAASTPGQGTQLTLTLPAEHQFLLG